MFVRSFAAIVLVLPSLAGAISIINIIDGDNNDAITGTNGVGPTAGTGSTTTDQCASGTLQCCQQVESADSIFIADFVNSIGAVLGGPQTLVGLSCSPITGVGIAGSTCTSQPVCCTNDNYEGIVATGCQPINIFARDLAGVVQPVVEGVTSLLGGNNVPTDSNAAAGGAPDVPGSNLGVFGGRLGELPAFIGGGFGDLTGASAMGGSTLLNDADQDAN